MRLLWGNFASRSREVSVTDAGREIARVPSMNLMRLHQGAVFSLAGRRWAVTRLTADRIDVRPSQLASDATLTYGGSRRRADPWTIEAILELVGDQQPAAGLSGPEALGFLEYVQELADATTGTLPYIQMGSGSWTYFTFAGEVANRVIAHASGAEVISAGDVFVEVSSRISFDTLSENPAVYEPIASEVLDSPLELTIYQALLPHDLLRKELGQTWTAAPVHGRTLRRLRVATPIEVHQAAFQTLRV
jgi:hypothetical protein